ncbi:DUF3558 domain-containing protein [Saccharopolyspora sp. SCSIO 74807]|uniref:DUF3558 domain-containing protein n=1 Tax=Saccharopolyspora sp. SCSIO 74807 TaxID=3118084 RepID=UPI00387EB794
MQRSILIESTGRLDTVVNAGNKLRAWALVGSVLLGSLLSACSPGQEAGQPPQPQASNPGGISVSDPKDPATVDSCSLLPAQGAESVGLAHQGRKSSSSFGDDDDNRCLWSSPDGAAGASLAVFADRTLQDYYGNSGQYVDFQKLTIAGHPAVRANEKDPMSDGMCSIFVASKPDQVVQAASDVPDPRTADPCDLAKKTLESAVPSWPAAK